MVLILTVWGAVRLFAALRSWDVLSEFGSSLSPLYLSMTGAGWGVAGGVLLSGILRRRKWTIPILQASVSVWLIEYWIERVFHQQPHANVPFAVVGSILIIGITLIITLHKSTLDFFTRSEEYEQQNEDPDSE